MIGAREVLRPGPQALGEAECMPKRKGCQQEWGKNVSLGIVNFAKTEKCREANAMANVEVSIPKGTRDFAPEVMARRNYIFNTIGQTFRAYGYQPIETPAIENLSTLLGKYGEEGDKLLFRVLNSGDFLKGAAGKDIWEIRRDELAALLCDRGLRYDLTVPFARYVAQHHGELTYPFKRYQMQPVWRADRPQKGRYREFTQCDVDIIGSDSLLNEEELIEIVDDVFTTLGLRVTIHVNNRKLLSAVAETLGASDRVVDLTVAIDKQEKIGFEGVSDELASKGFSPDQIARLREMIAVEGDNEERLTAIEAAVKGSPSARAGVEEVRRLLELVRLAGVRTPVKLDLSLARGLNYYTGAIFEVKAEGVQIGSVCGGGRYDNLTGIFGLKDMSGVGISFGADRIYDALMELNGFPDGLTRSCDVLVLNLSEESLGAMLRLSHELRGQGMRVTLYPDTGKMKKQMTYANRIGAQWVAIAGEEEMQRGEVAYKNMDTGEQENVPLRAAAEWLGSKVKS